MTGRTSPRPCGRNPASLAAAAVAILLMAAAAGVMAESVPLFESGKDGYHTYRIPALIRTKAGSLLAFCEGRKAGRGDAGDIDLVFKRSTDGGATWSEQEVLWDDGPNTCGNPCPVVDESTGTIWLLLTHNLGEDHESEIIKGTSRGTRTVWVTSSRDDGVSWDPPKEITATTKRTDWSWYATGPGVGIQLRLGPHRGRMVIPCDHKTLGDEVGYYSHVIHSDDHGATWNLGGRTPDGVNECQVIERTDGSLLLNMRRAKINNEGHRALSTSADGGATWSPLSYDRTLVSQRCMASVVRMIPPDEVAVGADSLVVFSNPADPARRVNMTVRLSRDDARTWSASRVIHAGPSAYSCLCPLDADAVALLYEGGDDQPYEKILFEIIPLASLK